VQQGGGKRGTVGRALTPNLGFGRAGSSLILDTGEGESTRGNTVPLPVAVGGCSGMQVGCANKQP
jgi:hypothetical protein